MFAIGVNSQWWVIPPGGYESQNVNVPAVPYLNVIYASLMVLVDNSGNSVDAQIVIEPPGPDTAMGFYCHGVPAFPIFKSVKAGAKEVITIPELFATAADYTTVPPTEVPKPPFAATSYNRGLRNLGPSPIRAMVAMAGMGFPIDWAGTTAPWFTWSR